MGEDVIQGKGYAVGHIDRMGDAYGFRKIRRELGVGAFGVNAISIPPGYETGGYVGRDGRVPDGETSRFGPSGRPGA